MLTRFDWHLIQALGSVIPIFVSMKITNNHQSLESCRKIENMTKMDLWIYQMWDQLHRRNKHRLPTGHIRLECHLKLKYL
jgi:hypothetical protein